MPVEVSSIRSVADRTEMPSDCGEAEREVVVLVPRAARQVEHDHEVHATLVQPAVPEQVRELTAIH